MKTITIRYGVDSITKQVEEGFTFGDVKENDSFRAALGYGDIINALASGVAQNDETVVPDNSEVVVETAANQKAAE